MLEGQLADAPITKQGPLLLGSGSPRRFDILRGLGVPLVVRPPGSDETVVPGEAPDVFLERVAQLKLDDVLAQAPVSEFAGVLVADTIVQIGGEVIGKPADVDAADALLQRLLGREHTVKTRYVLRSRSGRVRARTVTTQVRMRLVSDEIRRRYANSGEGLDKAGAYAVQGLGAFLVESINGSYTNVVGLPACEVVADLLELGLLAEFPSAGSNVP